MGAIGSTVDTRGLERVVTFELGRGNNVKKPWKSASSSVLRTRVLVSPHRMRELAGRHSARLMSLFLSVLPVHLPLSGDAGEDCGKMLHLP